MTIREELELLGPERVRAGMVAFEHRGKAHGATDRIDSCESGRSGVCCFLSHAATDLNLVQVRSQLLNVPPQSAWHTAPQTEKAFEFGRYGTTREELRLECIAYLAEHGTAIEVAPKKSPRAIRVAAVLCLLLLVLVV